MTVCEKGTPERIWGYMQAGPGDRVKAEGHGNTSRNPVFSTTGKWEGIVLSFLQLRSSPFQNFPTVLSWLRCWGSLRMRHLSFRCLIPGFSVEVDRAKVRNSSLGGRVPELFL